ncbi:MAG: hypothetical protein OEO79_10735 [Gemmatimonadota bacterium]|nr:hypothetical protein [Gemmatimonadota bacterium]MDH3422870.1 hypothetical protein [Gemmatimonadota bacterium]
MDCLRAREELWPPERPKLCEADVERAQAHVEACEECKLYFAQDRALLDAYDRVRRVRAPREVREEVFDALARARLEQEGAGRLPQTVSRRGLIAVGVALAASVTLFAAVSSFGTSDVASVGDPGIFAEDYLRRAVGQDMIVSSDPREVRRFLQRELGRSLGPMQLAGLEVERAEICLINGRRGALIVYKSGGGSISHYLVPSEGLKARAPSVADYHTGPAGDRMPLVTWATPELEQALVGEVRPEELLRIAALSAT